MKPCCYFFLPDYSGKEPTIDHAYIVKNRRLENTSHTHIKYLLRA